MFFIVSAQNSSEIKTPTDVTSPHLTLSQTENKQTFSQNVKLIRYQSTRSAGVSLTLKVKLEHRMSRSIRLLVSGSKGSGSEKPNERLFVCLLVLIYYSFSQLLKH